MDRIKRIAALVLAASLVFAGLPVMAQPECPMAASMEKMDAMAGGMESCDHCPEKTSEKPAASCCGDMECGAQCAAAAIGGGAMALPSGESTLLARTLYNTRFVITGERFASMIANTQDRPPRHLS